MDKKFIKSMVAAIAGLGLVSSCSMMGMKDSHKCATSKKVEETKKTTEETNKCGAKNGCAASKTETKSVKAKKTVTKKN